jgi:hypothetical protein
MEQSWMSCAPLSTRLNESILMSRLVGRLVSTPVTVRCTKFLSLLCVWPSSDRAARSADEPCSDDSVDPVVPLRSLRAFLRAAASAFFSS